VSVYGSGTYGSATYGSGAAATVDLSAVFEVAFADPPGVVSPTWTDLTSRLIGYSTARGRQMELDEIETGTLTATLRNQDRQLDPLLTSSVYYPNVVPIRQSRLQVSAQGVVYDVFRGDVQDWPQDWQGLQNLTPIQAFDAFDALADADFTSTRTAELSGARINAILDAIDWPAGMRAIDTGQSTMQARVYETANAKAELQLVAKSEQGVLFVAPTGVITFHDRHRRWKPPYNASQATFSNQPTGAELPLSDATLNYTKDRLRNYITVNQDGGVSVLRTDTTSLTEYRRRSFTLDTILNTIVDVESAADYLLAKGKDPIARVEAIVLEPQQDDDLWAEALGRELGDRVTTIIRPPGSPTTTITSVGTIERIEHSWDANTRRWVTTFRLSPADVADYWLTDTSVLDTNTRVGY
jgi:hypothetical protein